MQKKVGLLCGNTCVRFLIDCAPTQLNLKRGYGPEGVCEVHEFELKHNKMDGIWVVWDCVGYC